MVAFGHEPGGGDDDQRVGVAERTHHGTGSDSGVPRPRAASATSTAPPAHGGHVGGEGRLDIARPQLAETAQRAECRHLDAGVGIG